jgi:hypothetical protein
MLFFALTTKESSLIISYMLNKFSFILIGYKFVPLPIIFLSSITIVKLELLALEFKKYVEEFKAPKTYSVLLFIF